jgi:multimeric flavodoxin WrbA
LGRRGDRVQSFRVKGNNFEGCAGCESCAGYTGQEQEQEQEQEQQQEQEQEQQQEQEQEQGQLPHSSQRKA